MSPPTPAPPVSINSRVFPVGPTKKGLDLVPEGNRHDRFMANKVKTSKYSLINFVPKNLFEQFRRVANFYFLCITTLAVVTPNSPVSPITSLIPLCFVVFTTAAKQGYEDHIRHRQDRKTNHKPTQILRGHGWVDATACDLNVGDIFKVQDEQEIPCDMILLSCGRDDHKVQVMTANLDGETNMKMKECLELTKNMLAESDLLDLMAAIECEKPNVNLYEFAGNIKIQRENIQTFPLGTTNILLRGSMLKGSKFAIGVSVFTGLETKLALNLRMQSNKFSSIEKKANMYLIWYMCVLLVISTSSALLNINYQARVLERAWYIRSIEVAENPDPSGSFFHNHILNYVDAILSYFFIFNFLIPISLYVTLEMVKFFGSKTLINDKHLICSESQTKPKCNSSDLNEELGQVEFLFTDKTGTLTENMMRFTSCLVGNTIYDESNGQLMDKVTKTVLPSLTKDIEWFFTAIAVANTVLVIPKPNGTIEYQADSPDEKALVEAASRFGVILTESTDRRCTINIGSRVIHYHRLHIFHFDSTRKRMSVIAQDVTTKKINLFMKGAESEVWPTLKDGTLTHTLNEVDNYAQQGLRTLIIAEKEISDQELVTIQHDLQVAQATFENRKEIIASTQAKIETGLRLLGATAVEDRLQDGVILTIQALKEAGIKVWVLTGDKLETAVSVAYSCQLITSDMVQMTVARERNVASCGQLIQTYTELLDKTQSKDQSDFGSLNKSQFALIIDGRSLHLCMKHHENIFRTLCLKCAVVVCCRMSPIQKAEVVKLIKAAPGSPITAAIGDGANDVSMIQEADVGFGLTGLEGRQAANSADFSFGRFRFVKRILLVHGHYFYHQVTNLIHYFFYKCVVFVTPQFIFSVFNSFSSSTMYHEMLLMMYNMLFTGSPILIYGILEKNLPDTMLEKYPRIYSTNTKNHNMRYALFFSWMFQGVAHGTLIFIVCEGALAEYISSDGLALTVNEFGLTVYHCVVLVVTIKLLLISRSWNIYLLTSVIASIIALVTFILLYTSFKWDIYDQSLYGIYYNIGSTSMFYVALCAGVVMPLMPDLIFQFTSLYFDPEEVIRERSHLINKKSSVAPKAPVASEAPAATAAAAPESPSRL